MPRHPIRPPFILIFALLTLLLLAPTHAKALPLGHANSSAAEHPQAVPGLFSQLWSFLAALWEENGSSLAPNVTTASASSDPGSDNGSLLDPNG